MPRPATGSARWNTTGHWEIRLTLPNGTRHKPIPVDIATAPACLLTPEKEKPSRKCECTSCKRIRFLAKQASDKARRLGMVPDDTTQETVSEWFDRYYQWRAKRPRGAESVDDSSRNFRNWIEPKLGTMPMVNVTTDDLDAFAEYLDEQVEAGIIAWKTAGNIFGEITVGFAFAKKGKNKWGKQVALRVRGMKENPAADAAGPDTGDKRKKPFLRPGEVAALLSHPLVPLERRHVYAVAIYTAMRQGELRGLRVGDVDLEAMQISVSRQLKNGVEKDRTKTGRPRTVTIEPNLVPLLEILLKDKKPDERVLYVAAHNRCASHLREDLEIAGCKRDALHVAKKDPMLARMQFHNLRDTCLTHMSVRRDPPQDIQWRAGHTTPTMTELYIANARHEAGPRFGEPLAPLPIEVLKLPPPEAAIDAGSDREGFGSNSGPFRTKKKKNPDEVVEAPGIEPPRTAPASVTKRSKKPAKRDVQPTNDVTVSDETSRQLPVPTSLLDRILTQIERAEANGDREAMQRLTKAFENLTAGKGAVVARKTFKIA